MVALKTAWLNFANEPQNFLFDITTCHSGKNEAALPFVLAET
jgi:hypothetical protein